MLRASLVRRSFVGESGLGAGGVGLGPQLPHGRGRQWALARSSRSLAGTL